MNVKKLKVTGMVVKSGRCRSGGDGGSGRAHSQASDLPTVRSTRTRQGIGPAVCEPWPCRRNHPPTGPDDHCAMHDAEFQPLFRSELRYRTYQSEFTLDSHYVSI